MPRSKRDWTEAKFERYFCQLRFIENLTECHQTDAIYLRLLVMGKLNYLEC